MRTRVKICGFTRHDDALGAAFEGVDAIGMVFYDASPRNISLDNAHGIAKDLPAFVTKVGLFVNPGVDWVVEVISRVGLDCLQFHGDESPEFCRQFTLPYIKAIRVQSALQAQTDAQNYPDCAGILLDSFDQTQFGGTGRTFAWDLTPKINQPLILAGGLSTDNVRGAIAVVNPYAVDVSSGVESAKGIKDLNTIREFMTMVGMTEKS